MFKYLFSKRPVAELDTFEVYLEFLCFLTGDENLKNAKAKPAEQEVSIVFFLSRVYELFLYIILV